MFNYLCLDPDVSQFDTPLRVKSLAMLTEVVFIDANEKETHDKSRIMW